MNVNISKKSKAKVSGTLALTFLLTFCPIQSSWSSDWNLQDSDGIHHRLSALKGKWVLVNFWAPWCPPCLQEMPEFVELQKRHKDLTVIGVAVMYRKKQEVLKTVREHSLSYPIVLGNEDIASQFGGVEGLPTSYLYSPSGKLIGHHQGPLTQNDIETAMQQKELAARLFTP